jgi:hypothetical protein
VKSAIPRLCDTSFILILAHKQPESRIERRARMRGRLSRQTRTGEQTAGSAAKCRASCAAPRFWRKETGARGRRRERGSQAKEQGKKDVLDSWTGATQVQHLRASVEVVECRQLTRGSDEHWQTGVEVCSGRRRRMNALSENREVHHVPFLIGFEAGRASVDIP